ncbi:hypothetical protein OAF79_01925, partial [Akkermansiaceae bacterium]|nr:hypothetical protein [Akkermansiaceae bacterium]
SARKIKKGNRENNSATVFSKYQIINLMVQFNDLVEQYGRTLYRFSLILTKNPARAADFVWQAFVSMARGRHQLKNSAHAKTL